jgi:hypothetical protein
MRTLAHHEIRLRGQRSIRRIVYAKRYVELPAGQAGDLCGCLAPHVYRDQLIQIRQLLAVRAHAPVILAGLQGEGLVRDVFDEFEGAGTPRLLDEIAFEFPRHDCASVME